MINLDEEIDSYRRIFYSIPKQEIEQINQNQHNETEIAIEKFLLFYKRKECYLCEQSFEYIDKSKPCLHWLLRRCGFKKKDFPKIYQKYSYHQIASFLRWCANAEKMLRNINNLSEEKSLGKIISYTIRWKNIDWTFDCCEGDFVGHQVRGVEARQPHYHFQMRIDNQQFINYNDFHVPLTDEDIFYLKLRNEKWFHLNFGLGDGMQEAMDIPADLIIENVQPTDNEDEAVYHLNTFIECPDNPMSGEEIYQAQIEAKKTGKSMAYILQERIKDRNGTRITTVVSPVNTIPDIVERTPHNKGKNTTNS